MNKEYAKKIAKEILEILDNKEYKNIKLSNILDNSKAILYNAEFNFESFQSLWSVLRLLKKQKTNIKIIKSTTIDASVDFNGCILNFASATNPGGGFLGGSIAQEESLCRASLLYDSLLSCQEYYTQHKKNEFNDYFYTDSMLFSNDVMIIRNSNNEDIKPYYRDFLTCAAPMATSLRNSDPYTDYDSKLDEIINRRVRKILLCMLENGHTKALLGAWGCGAFGNDPYMVAEAFKSALEEFPFFEEVVFAIYEKDESKLSNYNIFKEVFENDWKEFNDTDLALSTAIISNNIKNGDI